VQIEIDDLTAVFFASAYLDTFNPASPSTNYLGDVGSTGNFFANRRYGQVVVPAGHNLIVVVEDTIPSNGGVGHAFGLQVEGFFDVNYDGGPTITKSFNPPTVTLGGTTTLSFTLTNPSPTLALTGVGFTDTMTGMVVAATPNVTNTCGGTL